MVELCVYVEVHAEFVFGLGTLLVACEILVEVEILDVSHLSRPPRAKIRQDQKRIPFFWERPVVPQQPHGPGQPRGQYRWRGRSARPNPL